jgi:hypothetical protein
MSTDDDPILAALRKLAGKVDAAPVMLWGTASQASPLMVMLDGAIDPAGAPVAVPAQSAVGPVKVGQRVYCVRQSRRVIVVGGGDTGWLTLPLQPGFEAYDPPRVPQYRVVGGMCHLSGLVKPSTGQFTNGMQFGTLPVGARPRRIAVQAAFMSFGYPGGVTTQPSGGLLYTGNAADYVYLDSVHFGV